MPEFKYGEMFSEFCNDNTYTIVTGNSTLRKDGRLVMGRGAALQLKNSHYNDISLIFGLMMPDYIDYENFYGLMIDEKSKCGILQVKYHFKDRAKIMLIAKSIKKLDFFASSKSDHKINMNFPGIGYGRLNNQKEYTFIKYLLKKLPDNVVIWEKK